jgi:hypothetical protein
MRSSLLLLQVIYLTCSVEVGVVVEADNNKGEDLKKVILMYILLYIQYHHALLQHYAVLSFALRVVALYTVYSITDTMLIYCYILQQYASAIYWYTVSYITTVVCSSIVCTTSSGLVYCMMRTMCLLLVSIKTASCGQQ